MGEINHNPLVFLTQNELKEFNTIGYTGKNSQGKKTNYEEYLNTLNKGAFSVVQTKYDNGNFCEEFLVTKVDI